jgi:hypothetical protein
MISMNVSINIVQWTNVAIFSFMEKSDVSSAESMLRFYIYMMIFSVTLNIP